MKKAKKKDFLKVLKIRVRNIENKKQKQLSIKSVINIFDEDLSQKTKNMLIC